ncbi:MAG: phage tail tube protein [Candidatus Margulisiibacteriota bacterium]
MSMLVRKRQLAAKYEAAEGTAEILSAQDAGILVNFTPKANYDPQMYQRDLVRTTLTKIGKLAGKMAAGLEFAIELRGSGSLTGQPKWAKLIEACGYELAGLKNMQIGGITGGPFQHGELITGGTSNATGRVVCATHHGASELYFREVSGVFANTETITGSLSGAICTAASAPQTAGYEIKPVSSDTPALTLGLYEDGVRKLLKGCRGSVKFSFKIGEPAIMDFSFMGVGAGVTDLPLLSDVEYETTVPPVLLDAKMSCGGVSLNIGEMEIDTANALASKDKIDDPSGILSYLITGRDMKGSFNPEMVAVGSHDFFGKWFAATPMELNLEFGSTEGNKFRIFAPKIVYNKVDDGNRDGIQLAQTSFDLTGSIEPGDDELSILLL